MPRYLSRYLILGAVLIVSSVFTGCRPVASNEDDGGGNINVTAAPQEPTRTVRVVRAEVRDLIATRDASVTIEPNQESRVASGTNGQVEAILFREGSRVDRDEVIVALDDDSLQIAVRNAELALSSARINSQSGRRSSQESTQQFEAQLATARSNVNLAKQRYEEGIALFDVGGIAQTELTSLEANLQQAEASLVQVQDSLARSQRAGQEDLALLELQVSQAEAELDRNIKALSEASISAPFAGEIAELYIEEGEFVGAGSQVFRIVSVDRQLGRFSVPPIDASRLLEAESINIRYAGLDFPARIIRSSSAPNQQRLVDIVAEIQANDNEMVIPSGSVAQLAYQISLGRGVVVPTGAIFAEGGQSFVYTVEGSRSKQRQIKLINEVSGSAVIEGLEDDALVVFPLPADLRDDNLVNIVDF